MWQLFLCSLLVVVGVLHCLDLWGMCNNPYVYTNNILHNISSVTVWISVYYYGLNSMQIQFLMKDNIGSEILCFFQGIPTKLKNILLFGKKIQNYLMRLTLVPLVIKHISVFCNKMNCSFMSCMLVKYVGSPLVFAVNKMNKFKYL